MLSATKRYFLLKSANNGSVLLWGFLQTFVFVRVFDHHDFSIIILINNAAMLLMLVDLGFSKIIFVDIREKFVNGNAVDHTDRVISLTTLYSLMVLGGALSTAIYVLYFGGSMQISPLVCGIYFLVVALNLPWQLLQNVCSAIDNFLEFEALDVVRRIVQIIILSLLLIFRIELVAFTCMLLTWIIAISIILVRLKTRGVTSRYAVDPFAWRHTLTPADKSAMLQSAVFIGSETVMYQAPLLLTPLFYGLGAPVIIVDTVFRFFRASISLFKISSETLIPLQTQAYFSKDWPELRRRTYQVLGVSAAFAGLIAATLLLFGHQIFAALLSSRELISTEAILCILALVGSNVLQNTFGSLLVITGFFKDLSRVGACIAALVLVALPLMGAVSGSIIDFLFTYVACYMASAIVYSWLASRRVLKTQS
jgi:O-antigen/teichoic acid export membrane protein